jgi:hypothetical protein
LQPADSVGLRAHLVGHASTPMLMSFSLAPLEKKRKKSSSV